MNVYTKDNKYVHNATESVMTERQDCHLKKLTR